MNTTSASLTFTETQDKYKKHLKEKALTSKTSEWNINYIKDKSEQKYIEKVTENLEHVNTINTNTPSTPSLSTLVLENNFEAKRMSSSENREEPSGTSSSQGSFYLNSIETAEFIKQNIHQRECILFVPKEANKCKCGRAEAEHVKDVKKAEPSIEWKAKDHTKTMPCFCFGQIQFRGFGGSMTTPLYARIDTDSKCQDVWELMIEKWKMPIPRLLISVTGGAQRFELKPRLSAILKQGLIEAALNTGAWIITGGTKSGVMEFVGEAVKDHMTIKGSSSDDILVALGVVTWGIVGNKDALKGGDDGFGLWPAEYESGKLSPKATALDPNHTHFLLVDDGSEGMFGREIPFRSRFEKFISDLNPPGVSKDQEIHIPNVLIVVEGGVGTIDTVRESLANETPVVLIKGSGRAADYLATSFDDATKDPELKFVKEADIKKIFDLKDDEKVKKCVQSLKDCFKSDRMGYLNIFDLEKSTSFKDIDREILYALLKANKSDCKSQLALALAWRRCDVAQQQIFTSENRSQWTPDVLNNAMFTALVQDQTDFVQLLLDNGVDIKKFLTLETLWNLYYNCINLHTTEAAIMKDMIKKVKGNNVKKCHWLSCLCCCPSELSNVNSDLLVKVNSTVANLLEDQSFNFYESEHFTMHGDVPTKPEMKWLAKESSRRQSSKEEFAAAYQNVPLLKDQVTSDFEYPARDLFIFAVLFNRQNMAKLFLKIGSDQIGMSLLGSSILKALSKKAAGDEETALSEDLLAHSCNLELFAKAALNECYLRSKQDAHTLLYREMKQLGNMSILLLVDRQDLMDFAEHPACQTKLTSLWKGHLSPKTSVKKIVLTCFFPILILTLKFLQPKYENSTNMNKVSPVRCLPRKKEKSFSKYTEVKVGFSKDTINVFSAIYKFYSAPVIKFTNNIVAYLVLLGLFSYFLLTNMSPVSQSDSPSIIEYIVWAWFITLFLEEIRQVIEIQQKSFCYKLSIWWNNSWNHFDLLMYILMIVSVILRYILEGEDFVYARIVYSITLVMLYLRFMQFYFAEQNMGPKVIMIRRMLTDLTFFFFILIVFILAFGVAYHVNMFPNQTKDWSILYTVFLYPYFQIYGELFLDDLKGKDDGDGCTKNQSIWETDPTQRCPEKNAIVYIFLSIYLVLINILLINLLIAMFSYTFQKVQDNSTKVWRFHRISLVNEYFDRPSLVPPLIVINHLWRILCFIFPCFGKHENFGVKLSEDAIKRLRLFEKAAVETCLLQAATKEKDLLENQVASTVSRLDYVMDELHRIKEIIQNK
ncbi:transient receptor potential cation channel subfamily M member 2 [Biomphalaria glabrata]|nr:transient receptor potential cation channel subfamily M member 2 [Biomphalaria glabrata]